MDKHGVTAIVEYEYTAKEPDELDLVKGAIIHSIKQMPGGWWEGTLKTTGKTGMFPDNFVRVIDAVTAMSATNDDNDVTLREKSATKNRRCKVIYSYTQVNDDELSLAVGDVIEFLGEVEEGWWRGRLKTKVGVFPSNFVVDIEPSPVFASKRPTSTAVGGNLVSNNSTSTSSLAAAAAATTNTTAATASVLANAALAAVTTKKSNRLSFHSSKEDLLGSSPSNNSSSSSNTMANTMTSAVNNDVAPVLPPKPQREYCRVEFPYAPQNEDELELKVGDVITIISTELPDKGWWKGELRGKIGVFPDNFVKMMTPPDVIPTENEASQSQSQQQQQQKQEQQPKKTAKTINTVASSSLTTTSANANNASTSSTNITQSQSSKVFIKKSGSTSSTQSSNRKDSFGSYDSLNDILSETGLQTGNVAAQRKSLENKNLDLTNTPDAGIRMGLKKPQQQQHTETTTTTKNAAATSNTTTTNSSPYITTTNELRKSLENLDEKSTKTTPPPVLTKKPSVPTKKSTTVTSVAANLFTSLKTKAKNIENTLTTSASTDAADGIGSSKVSPSSAGILPDAAPSGNVLMRRAATISEDTDFDRVERASILTDMRAGRVKAPKRRPPSAAINAIGESNNNNPIYLNGSSSSSSSMITETIEETMSSGNKALAHSSDDNSSEEQLAKPKPREWDKKKAPWMEELKASQVKKKTSPNVEPRAIGGEVKLSSNNNSATTATSSASSTSTVTKVQSATISSSSTSSSSSSISTAITSSTMQQSMIVEGSKKEQITTTTTANAGGIKNLDLMSKSFSSKLHTNSNAEETSIVDDLRATRPSSLSIRNRSVSPSHASDGNSARNARPTLKSANSNSTSSSTSPGDALATSSQTHSTISTAAKSHNTHTHVNNHQHYHQVNATAHHQATHNGSEGQQRIVELERRVEKLEGIVNTQQRTIDELVRTLREETARVKVLRGELDKYAQCVTQV